MTLLYSELQKQEYCNRLCEQNNLHIPPSAIGHWNNMDSNFKMALIQDRLKKLNPIKIDLDALTKSMISNKIHELERLAKA